jgi:opacity protein-like surface antigen
LVHGINRYAVDFGPSFSVEGGVAFQFDIAGDWLSIAPELHYQWFRANGKGDKSDGKGKDAYEAGVSAHQVELPVLLRFNFQGLALELGPEFAYTIASTSTQKLTYSDSPENNFKSEDDTYKLNGFGFGVVAGVGYTVLPGLLIDARYSYGFLEHAQDNGHPWTLSLGAVFLVL